MKTTIATVFLALACLITVNAAMAQMHEVRAQVPFDFVVGSTELPAGIYIITSDEDNRLRVQNGERQAVVMNSFAAEAHQSNKANWSSQNTANSIF